MKVLALTTDGRITYCSCPPELRGKGRCNHITHQNEGESTEEFIFRVNNKLKEELSDLLIEDKLERIKNSENLDIFINDKDYRVRAAVAEQGYGLKKLINDENWEVRVAVAGQGYALNLLINDKESGVRLAVAKQGYGLHKLIEDENWEVREFVAEQGFGLDKLINDKDFEVRLAIAKQGYGLEKLIEDEESDIRIAVAEQGFGLEKLVKDTDPLVRKAAEEYISNNKEKFGWCGVKEQRCTPLCEYYGECSYSG